MFSKGRRREREKKGAPFPVCTLGRNCGGKREKGKMKFLAWVGGYKEEKKE